MHSTTPLPASKPSMLPSGTRSDCLLRRLDEILNRRTASLTLPGSQLLVPCEVFPATSSLPAKQTQREDRPVVDQLAPALPVPSRQRATPQLETRRDVEQRVSPAIHIALPHQPAKKLDTKKSVDQQVSPAVRMALRHQPAQELEIKKRVDQLDGPIFSTISSPKTRKPENGGSVDQLRRPVRQAFQPDLVLSAISPQLDIERPVDQLVRPAVPVALPRQSAQELDIEKHVDQQSRPGDVSQETHPAVARIESRPDLFARQGSVSATWRHRNGKTFGPYYRLSYRDAGRQCAIYLGREGPLVECVRQMLHKLQEPLRLKRVFDRFDRNARVQLRANNAHLAALLRPYGLRLKGFEVRGWRTCVLRHGLPSGGVKQPLKRKLHCVCV